MIRLENHAYIAYYTSTYNGQIIYFLNCGSLQPISVVNVRLGTNYVVLFYRWRRQASIVIVSFVVAVGFFYEADANVVERFKLSDSGEI